ncbi:MAG: DUF2764 domain-containing protein [Bacteroidaceae bacterium]|nr:DUF2764 domain-containing protein [Bacteroidaceae bacterium]
MYYTILTGQPPLRPDKVEQRASLAEMKDMVIEATSGKDARDVQTFFLRFDCMNLVRLLRNGKTEEINPLGLLSREQLDELMLGQEGTGWGLETQPEFLRAFTARYRKKANQIGWFSADDILLQYYDYAISHSDGILSEWYELNLNLQSLMTAFIARKNNWRVADYVKGQGEVCDAIRNSSAADFGLAAQLPYIDEIIKIADEPDPVSKEKQTDAFKWKWLDEHSFMEPFDIVALIFYLARTEMLDRWDLLDVEQGKARFTAIINNLRGEARVPAEFIRK